MILGHPRHCHRNWRQTPTRSTFLRPNRTRHPAAMRRLVPGQPTGQAVSGGCLRPRTPQSTGSPRRCRRLPSRQLRPPQCLPEPRVPPRSAISGHRTARSVRATPVSRECAADSLLPPGRQFSWEPMGERRLPGWISVLTQVQQNHPDPPMSLWDSSPQDRGETPRLPGWNAPSSRTSPRVTTLPRPNLWCPREPDPKGSRSRPRYRGRPPKLRRGPHSWQSRIRQTWLHRGPTGPCESVGPSRVRGDGLQCERDDGQAWCRQTSQVSCGFLPHRDRHAQ